MKKPIKSLLIGLAIAVGVTTPSQVKAQSACVLSGTACEATLTLTMNNLDPSFSLPVSTFELPDLSYKSGITLELEIPITNTGSADLDIFGFILDAPSHITSEGAYIYAAAGETVNMPVLLQVDQNDLDSSTVVMGISGFVYGVDPGPITVN